jgi:hypothetical protein
MSTPALAQRRVELMRARRVLDVELARVTRALLERQAGPRHAPITHGAAGFKRGCHCPRCRAGKADEKRRERANRSDGANRRDTS